MGRLPRLQVGQVFHEVQDAGYGPLSQWLGVNAGRRRHHRVPACQAGPSHKLPDPGAAGLYPSHARRAGRHGGGLLPVEVKADVGLTEERGPLGPLRIGEGRGRAMVVARIARLRQQVRPVDDLNARMGRNARHMLLLKERADQGPDNSAHAIGDRIASDIWKALNRCPVAKLASMPTRNANAGASRDGCTTPTHISGV